MKKFWTYVRRNVPLSEFVDCDLNGYYDLSFFLSYPGYSHPSILSVTDGDAIPWIPMEWRRIFIADVADSMTESEIAAFVAGIPKEFGVSMFQDVESARAWVRSNFAFPEPEPGKFLVSPAFADVLTGKEVPARYLTI